MEKQLENFSFPEEGAPTTAVAQAHKLFQTLNGIERETKIFFEFLGLFAVEYYCLDALTLQGKSDVGFKIKMEGCQYLTPVILSDFFTNHFFPKYLSPSITELLQKRFGKEMANLSQKVFDLQAIRPKDLFIPEDLFPDYSILQTAINKSLAKRSIVQPLPGPVLVPAKRNSQCSDKGFMNLLNLEKVASKEEKENVQNDKDKEPAEITDANSKASVMSSGGVDRNSKTEVEPNISVGRGSDRNLIPRRETEGFSRFRLADKLKQDGRQATSIVLSDAGSCEKNGTSRKRQKSLQRLRQSSGLLPALPLATSLEIITLDQQMKILDVLSSKSTSTPFSKAITELRLIQFAESPLGKIQCFYKGLSTAIYELQDYCVTLCMLRPGSSSVLTLETLVSIFTFMVIKGKLSSLPVHLKIIQTYVFSKGLLDTDRLCRLIERAIAAVNQMKIA